MSSSISRDQAADDLRRYKTIRDSILHDEPGDLEHHLRRFVEFAERSSAIKAALDGIMEVDGVEYMNSLKVNGRVREFTLPSDPAEELAVQFGIIRSFADKRASLSGFGISYFRTGKQSDTAQKLRSLILRPFFEELGTRLARVAQLATPEERDVQAVPFDLLPGKDDAQIFLSHKSSDKSRIQLYHRALKQLGYRPWLDEEAMPAGSNLNRAILKGVEKSCAVVFFITESFQDERWLADEIDHAVEQKRERGDKFAIITLCFGNTVTVPSLLRKYVYRNVENDLDGLYQIVRALPVELGPLRWKPPAQ
jgi:hypothetical protein